MWLGRPGKSEQRRDREDERAGGCDDPGQRAPPGHVPPDEQRGQERDERQDRDGGREVEYSCHPTTSS
jgi:hypothetical protein